MHLSVVVTHSIVDKYFYLAQRANRRDENFCILRYRMTRCLKSQLICLIALNIEVC